MSSERDFETPLQRFSSVRHAKMKEMADHTRMPASVLSSLYSSVLPTFLKLIHKGESEDAALDYALSQVNNVSKKGC